MIKESITWYPITDKKPPSGLGVLISNESDPYCVFAMWNPEKCFWAKVDEPFKEIKNFKVTYWAFCPEGVMSTRNERPAICDTDVPIGF